MTTPGFCSKCGALAHPGHTDADCERIARRRLACVHCGALTTNETYPFCRQCSSDRHGHA